MWCNTISFVLVAATGRFLCLIDCAKFFLCLKFCSGPSLDSPGDGDGMGGGGGGDSLGDGPGPSHRRPPGSSSVMKKTAQQIAGESVLSRVVEEVEGVNFSFK